MTARCLATVTLATAIGVGMAGPAVAAQPAPGSAAPVDVIVRELPGAGDQAERAVAAFGGTVGRHLGIIDAFTASVPGDRLGALRATPGVSDVTEDAGLELSSKEVEDQAAQVGSLYTLANQVTGASAMWDAGYTGQGIDVAVVDSGVVPVKGLDDPGKVVYGPDLTLETNGSAKQKDTYGHGTHMSGIIAGRELEAKGTRTSGDTTNFVGMAPDARIVSVKVADAQGQTDVSQAIAAIDWVVQNRNKNGLNIRVLNLSFGTDGVQSYLLDPLAFAAEQAWHKGIVVVVAGGNTGYGSAKLNNPAYDPYVIAVGGLGGRGTADPSDDIVPSWSATGD